MSVTVGMRRVSAGELEALLRLQEPVLEWEESDDLPEWDADESSLDLHKAWDGLNFLLTQTAQGEQEPFCYLTSGGKVITGGEAGYERLLAPAEVAAFDGMLSNPNCALCLGGG